MGMVNAELLHSCPLGRDPTPAKNPSHTLGAQTSPKHPTAGLDVTLAA